MKITIVCVGKIKEKYFTGAIEEYAKRLGRYCSLTVTEVADEKTPDGAGEALELQIKEKEAYIVDLKLVVPDERQAIKLCDNWKKKSSQIYSRLLKDLM